MLRLDGIGERSLDACLSAPVITDAEMCERLRHRPPSPTQAGGALFMGDVTSARDAASTILTDLQQKGLIDASGA
jgi:hypothetical protein